MVHLVSGIKGIKYILHWSQTSELWFRSLLAYPLGHLNSRIWQNPTKSVLDQFDVSYTSCEKKEITAIVGLFTKSEASTKNMLFCRRPIRLKVLPNKYSDLPAARQPEGLCDLKIIGRKD